MSTRQLVYNYLNKHQIQYAIYDHEPAFTVEEAQKYCSHIPGMHCKNLFLRDHKGKRHFLLIIPNTKPVDLKSFNQLLQDRLSFASPERMMKYLGVEPGSVSVFGLINDKKSEVILYVDRDVFHSHQVTFHPNDNSGTLVLDQDMFHAYLKTLKNVQHIIEF